MRIARGHWKLPYLPQPSHSTQSRSSKLYDGTPTTETDASCLRFLRLVRLLLEFRPREGVLPASQYTCAAQTSSSEPAVIIWGLMASWQRLLQCGDADFPPIVEQLAGATTLYPTHESVAGNLNLTANFRPKFEREQHPDMNFGVTGDSTASNGKRDTSCLPSISDLRIRVDT